MGGVYPVFLHYNIFVHARHVNPIKSSYRSSGWPADVVAPHNSAIGVVQVNVVDVTIPNLVSDNLVARCIGSTGIAIKLNRVITAVNSVVLLQCIAGVAARCVSSHREELLSAQ